MRSRRAAAALVVPAANRGLKSPTTPRSASASPAQPVDQALAIIDFLTFSAPLHVLAPGTGEFAARLRADAYQGGEDSIELLARYALDALFPGSGLHVERKVRGFRNFYEHHVRILTPGDETCGFIALGGERQRGTWCLELTGAGCAHVKAWAHSQDVLEGWHARLTRVDCAHDDFAGTHSLADVESWHAEGRFVTQGRPPVLGRQGFEDGSGKTIYIGKNTGNQQLCCYEKGKQLGDPNSPWVRYEGRFGAKYREIEYAILTAPWEYLVGHYPALSWISTAVTRMQTAVAKAAACMAGSLRHARRQCGRVVNALFSAFDTPDQQLAVVTKLLNSDGFPAWVSRNELGPKVLAPILHPDVYACLAI